MKALSKNCASKRYIHTSLLYQRISTVNKYSSAGHHEQKNKKTTGPTKFSAVTIKQRIKLVLQHSLCKNEYNILFQVLSLHGLSTIFPV